MKLNCECFQIPIKTKLINQCKNNVRPLKVNVLRNVTSSKNVSSLTFLFFFIAPESLTHTHTQQNHTGIFQPPCASTSIQVLSKRRQQHQANKNDRIVQVKFLFCLNQTRTIQIEIEFGGEKKSVLAFKALSDSSPNCTLSTNFSVNFLQRNNVGPDSM